MTWTKRQAQTRRMTTKRLLLLLVVAMGITVTVVQTRRGATNGPSARTFHVIGTVTAPVAERRVMVRTTTFPATCRR